MAAQFTLNEGESQTFLLQTTACGDNPARTLNDAESDACLAQTVDYWLNWIAKCTYSGRWREMVRRPALALELPVYESSGAIVAAPTTPANFHRWARTRDRIYEQVLRKGWNPRLGAFVQHYGGTTLDASCLMMPLVFFISPTDPKMTQTLDAICRPVSKGGLLSDGGVYRYASGETEDGLRGGEGTFNTCGFSLIEALTRAGRTDPVRLSQAHLLFEKMLGQANHLGLYSEEAGLRGEALGNFPQAFAHLGLISAAENLDRVLEGQNPSPRR